MSDNNELPEWWTKLTSEQKAHYCSRLKDPSKSRFCVIEGYATTAPSLNDSDDASNIFAASEHVESKVVEIIPDNFQGDHPELLNQSLIERRHYVNPDGVDIEQLLPVTPDDGMVELVSNALGKPITSEKSPRDYALQEISERDRELLVFMRAGVENIKPGDYPLATAKIDEMLLRPSNIHDLRELQSLTEKQDINDVYHVFPFHLSWAQDIRAQYLLQTKRGDSFDSLNPVLGEALVSKGIMKADDWNVLQQAINKGRARIEATDQEFLGVLPGFERGKVTEMKDIDLESDLGKNLQWLSRVDQRKDSLDSVTSSMREMVNAANGKKMANYSYGPGFVTPFMKELDEDFGVKTVAFRVSDGELKGIKLVRTPKALDGVELPAYGPTLTNYAHRMGFINNTGKNIGQVFEEHLANKDTIFFTVNSAVVGPENRSGVLSTQHLDAGEYSTKMIPAAETFVYEPKIGPNSHFDDPFNYPNQPDYQFYRATRLYFYPYKQTDVNPYFQGGLVMGGNDHSFQSGWKDPGHASLKKTLTDCWDYIPGSKSAGELGPSQLKEKADRMFTINNGHDAFWAARSHLKHKGVLLGNKGARMDMPDLDTELKIMSGHFAQSSWQMTDLLAETSILANAKNETQKKLGLSIFSGGMLYKSDVSALNARFDLMQYLKTGNPMGTKKPTVWNHVSSSISNRIVINNLDDYLGVFKSPSVKGEKK